MVISSVLPYCVSKGWNYYTVAPTMNDHVFPTLAATLPHRGQGKECGEESQASLSRIAHQA